MDDFWANLFPPQKILDRLSEVTVTRLGGLWTRKSGVMTTRYHQISPVSHQKWSIVDLTGLKLIRNPLLLENRKFAVRVYMLVARTNPMLVFHYNFGYIKRCGQYYDENKFNREDLFRHVTKQDSCDNSIGKKVISIYFVQELGTSVHLHVIFCNSVCIMFKSVCRDLGTSEYLGFTHMERWTSAIISMEKQRVKTRELIWSVPQPHSTDRGRERVCVLD